VKNSDYVRPECSDWRREKLQSGSQPSKRSVQSVVLRAQGPFTRGPGCFGRDSGSEALLLPSRGTTCPKLQLQMLRFSGRDHPNGGLSFQLRDLVGSRSAATIFPTRSKRSSSNCQRTSTSNHANYSVIQLTRGCIFAPLPPERQHTHNPQIPIAPGSRGFVLGDFRTPAGVRNSSRKRTGGFGRSNTENR
jgi:hypothetical protein